MDEGFSLRQLYSIQHSTPVIKRIQIEKLEYGTTCTEVFNSAVSYASQNKQKVCNTHPYTRKKKIDPNDSNQTRVSSELQIKWMISFLKVKSDGFYARFREC